MDRPVFALDVDGVLSNFAAKPATRAKRNVIQAGQFKLWLGWNDGELLKRLLPTFELVWATTWEHDANVYVAPALGLPELPVVEVGNSFERSDLLPPRKFSSNFASWKTDGVLAYVQDRPLVWLDDDFTNDDRSWANKRTRRGWPTLLLKARPAEGLRPFHIDKALKWAGELTDARQGQEAG